VADIKPGRTFARTYEGQLGLPRGRNRLSLRAVRASQRERLLRSVIAAVSELGYPAVTVSDVVRRARVSRAAFYAHFADKEECFLTATGEGRQLMFAGVVSAARALPADAPDEQMIRAAYRAFLAFLTDERAFARGFYIDMPAAGPRAVGRLEAASRRFADLNRTWHQRARERHPDWPAVPDEAYLALAGATAELVRSLVRADRTDELPDLEDSLVALHLAVLAARPWHSPKEA
jgi:AcrR family transcriptional regulator